MNKYIFNGLAGCMVAMAAGFASSCSDALDVTPDGRMTLDEVWASADYTEAFLSSAFDQIPRKHDNYYWVTNLPIGICDDGWSCDDVEGVGPGVAYKGQGSAERHLLEYNYNPDVNFDCEYWKRYFGAIRQINMFLENIPTAAVYSESKRDCMINEAKILRAYYYLELVKWYGDVPIILEVPDISSDMSEFVREPAWKVLQQCVADCESALESPNVPWRIANLSERNRMTLSIACAIMSEAAVFAASPLNCEGQNLWNWAYSKTQRAYKLLVDHDFALYTGHVDQNYNSSYQELFAGSPGYPAEREKIMGGRPEAPNQPNYWVWGMPIQSNYMAGVVPTQELVDCYDMLATGKPVLDYEQPYLDETHLQPNYYPNSGYNEKKPFDGRDLRFDAVCVHNGSKVCVGDAWMTVATNEGGNCELRDDARTNTRTGYYNNKYRQWYSCASKRASDGAWVFFRFAHAMMNYAEAAIEVNDLPTAMSLINEIRHRAGFDPSVDLDPKGNKDLARLMYRKERRTEFAFEENRYFDNRRWGTKTENIECEKFTTGMKVIRKGFSYSYERFVVGSDGSAPSKLSYEAKWRRMPVPIDEVKTLEEKTGQKWQNYGW